MILLFPAWARFSMLERNVPESEEPPLDGSAFACRELQSAEGASDAEPARHSAVFCSNDSTTL